MKKFILTLTLAIVSNASLANGFSPWEARSVAPDTIDAVSVAKERSTGFAPWEERGNVEAFANETGIAMEIHSNNVFRPWS